MFAWFHQDGSLAYENQPWVLEKDPVQSGGVNASSSKVVGAPSGEHFFKIITMYFFQFMTYFDVLSYIDSQNPSTFSIVCWIEYCR